jgi:hypothetical protein
MRISQYGYVERPMHRAEVEELAGSIGALLADPEARPFFTSA